MNVGDWFLWPELRQSSPTRKAKPSYKPPVSSINCCSIFRGWSSEHWSKKTTRNGAPKGLGTRLDNADGLLRQIWQHLYKIEPGRYGSWSPEDSSRLLAPGRLTACRFHHAIV